MKKKGVLIICLLTSGIILAQPRTVTLTAINNPNRTISLYADNISTIDYTIKLALNLKGYTADLNNNSMVRVSPGRTKIATLSPALGSVNDFSATFRFGYASYPGLSFRKKPDADILYLIPATQGNNLRISAATDMAETPDKESRKIPSTVFVYKPGDTICAARAGRIYEASDAVKDGENTSMAHHHNHNRMAMEHKDGTISSYAMVAPIRLLAAIGDDVIPGQPLAVFEKGSNTYTLQFTVFYIDEKKALVHDHTAETKTVSPFEYINPVFYTGAKDAGSLLIDQVYTVVYDKEIIAKELNKKEKKKLGIQ